ncbi:SDR family NAD(P)-dependent oxidoreductase [Simiduia aestuariiviva]|uniref:NAD(P)-dependent dehydrogenase (Short-subunit alcohol dehydrogenase family) n=1 Tax=Simiduia aestuariiviva TaxID=1510459 RepID=A0A839UVF5_9GAMM|nr:SDR family NAD(P)-dependent oxidoreductase [Simiduia aestuariiviva]MBB3169325.1 NAD(P)-dependent dehydrogenase (short-subunit alcohol dehydrogenase family) [Simiduia aestuariiviva]
MITGKTVWVTGASAGIGKAIAEQLLQSGNHVIASARSADSLRALAGARPGQLSVLPFDVSDTAALPAVTAQMRALTDFIDIAIFNAGTCEYVDLPAFEPAMFERVFNTNVQGVVNSLSVALPLLQRSTSGQIVAVSSLSSLVPFPRAEAYGASKAALDYLMDTLRIDLAPLGVDVTLVQPGFVATPLTDKNDFPMPGLMRPADAAHQIIWAAHKRKRLHRFPRRLAWPLAFFSQFRSLWDRFIAPAMSRKSNSPY